MALPTREDAAALATLCREYVAVHEQRNPDHPYATIKEQLLLMAIEQALAVLRREAVSPLSETAA